MKITESELSKPKEKRLFAPVTAETHRQVRIAAATRELSLQEWLTEAVNEKLARDARANLAVVKGES